MFGKNDWKYSEFVKITGSHSQEYQQPLTNINKQNHRKVHYNQIAQNNTKEKSLNSSQRRKKNTTHCI
jgi:triacylglycerol esterase/lipase EstA (alpha/beta hydrolase family)